MIDSQPEITNNRPSRYADIKLPLVARLRKLWRAVHMDLRGIHPGLWLVTSLFGLLPRYAGGRMRIVALRMLGFDIAHGTVAWEIPTISGGADLTRRLHVGRNCRFNLGCYLELGADITIGDQVGLGPQVMILTTTHEFGPPGRRSGAPRSFPVTIGSGSWIGARAMILPGVTIGEGVVVAAGAVVTKDVPPNSLVAGVPARVIKELP